MSLSPSPVIFKLPAQKRFAQRVDATTALMLKGLVDEVDRKTLVSLMIAVRAGMKKATSRGPLKPPTSLYKRYRGIRFPITDTTGVPTRVWRYNSPWMKYQMALLCLSEGKFVQFRVTVHDQLAAELQSKGIDLKIYLRDRIKRCIRDMIGEETHFLFVIEDRDELGNEVRPHIHGSIQIHRAKPKPKKDGKNTVATERAIRMIGVEKFEYLTGRRLLMTALRRASGNDGKRPTVVHGRSQTKNIWHRDKYHVFNNVQYISYMFKNAATPSKSLSVNRMSMSLGLKQETQRLWRLITEGEPALSLWGVDKKVP
ncbi:MAG: hypothetical protein ABI668_13415 [Sphingorhabdus sp.]